jgi:putative endonuclease
MDHIILGKEGEKLAEDFLIKSGFEIIEKNWRTGNLEVDLIAKKSKILIFVEVKTRFSNKFGEPESFVNKQKQKFLIQAAAKYVEKTNIEEEIRFDVISITFNSGNWKINHFEEAFRPFY